ncbi:MAG: ABC transporter permease [Actinomycetota bacterium]
MRDRLVTLGWQAVPVLLAFGLAAAIFAVAGFDVVGVVDGAVQGSVTGNGAAANTIRWSIPLILIGVGVAVSLRAGEFNIGGQGQFLIGQCAAVWVGLRWDLPNPWAFIAAVILAVVAGALWSGIAGALKLTLGADEVITTLMLNFVALNFVQWLTSSSLTDPLTSGDAASTARLDPALRLQGSGQISLTLVLVTAAVVVGVWLLLERTPLGLGTTMVGANPTAAGWQGLPVTRIRFSSYLVAGGLAGLAGATEVFGPAGRVVTGATPTLGFTALLVAVVASLSIFGTVGIGLFFGALQAAVLFLPIVSDLPPSGLRILEGMVALLITAQLAVVIRSRRSGDPTGDTVPAEPAGGTG